MKNKSKDIRSYLILRILDVVFSLLGLVVGMPFLILLYAVGLFDTGSPLFRQERVGIHQKGFVLVKFRTMKVGSSSVASHLMDANAITGYGRFLRKTKLDELPQLWNVLKGDMSLVGPRPGLPSQTELNEVRKSQQVFNVRPGITGLAQIQGIDMSTPKLLACTDRKMLQSLSVKMYFKYIFITITGKGSGDAVRH